MKENKKLVASLLVSFVVIALFTGIIGYVSTSSTKESINQLVGEQSTSIAFSALNKIDISVANKISELKKLGKESLVQNTLILSNRPQQILENRIISDKLNEKIILDEKESGYRTYENIVLRNIDDEIIASSGNPGEDIFEEILVEETKEHGVFVNDVYYDEILDEEVYSIGILVTDNKGEDIGSIYALINFEEVRILIDGLEEESQFTSSEFDLFYDDGFLLYSTVERPEEYSISEIILEFGEESDENIEEEFEKLDEQYDQILQEFGYEEPELTEEQWEILEEKLLPLDEQYEEILEEYEFEDISED